MQRLPITALCVLIETSPYWLTLLMLAAWITHVSTSANAEYYLVMVFGAVVAPVGIIHGVMIWIEMPWI